MIGMWSSGRAVLLCLALSTSAARAQSTPTDDEAVLREAERIERAFVNLVAKVQRSTVSVINYREFEDPKTKQKVERPAGVGSGFIVGRDGRIFTNVHVIAEHSRIEVVLHDGRVLPATELAEVTSYDFALIVVKQDGLDAAEWAKSSRVEPGQFVIAAGNPRALAMRGRPVVTLGIISGKNRLAPGGYDYGNAFQTDAEINPGNSGGPLFDTSGRIIGINGKIAAISAAATNVGVGYSIPARQVQNFLPALLLGGYVEPGFSGLSVKEQTGMTGVVVENVAPASPAAKAGLKAGDRIVAVNGTRIDNWTGWKNEVSMLPGGFGIALGFYRKDKMSVKKFELEARSRPLERR